MGSELTTAFTTAITSIKADVITLVSAAAPPSLAIAGIGIALRIGMNFFRSIAR